VIDLLAGNIVVSPSGPPPRTTTTAAATPAGLEQHEPDRVRHAVRRYSRHERRRHESENRHDGLT